MEDRSLERERAGLLYDTESLRGKRVRPAEWILLAAVHGAAGISIFLLLGIAGYVFSRGFRGLTPKFFTSVTNVLKGTVGIAGNLVNTLYLIALALAVAAPMGVGAAVYLNEYAGKGRLVRVISSAVDILAGIPSVLFGLFGMILFGEVMGLGYSLLSGSLTLALMVLPLIVENTVTALRRVPEGYRQGALGMGAGKWELIRTILLPCAGNGIMSGILLSVGRILGESAALLFTAGSARSLPRLGDRLWKNFAILRDKVREPGGSLAVELYLQMQNGEYGTAFAIGCVLILLVAALQLILRTLFRAGRSEGGKGGAFWRTRRKYRYKTASRERPAQESTGAGYRRRSFPSGTAENRR